MDSSVQQQIDDIKRNADYEKQRIDQQTADQIRAVTEQEAQRQADQIRQQGEDQANQVGS